MRNAPDTIGGALAVGIGELFKLPISHCQRTYHKSNTRKFLGNWKIFFLVRFFFKSMKNVGFSNFLPNVYVKSDLFYGFLLCFITGLPGFSCLLYSYFFYGYFFDGEHEVIGTKQFKLTLLNLLSLKIIKRENYLHSI